MGEREWAQAGKLASLAASFSPPAASWLWETAAKEGDIYGPFPRWEWKQKKIELKLHKIGIRRQLAPCSTSPVHKFNDISSLFLFFSRRPYLRGSFYYLPVDTVVLLVMRWGLISSLIFPLAAASVETELCAPQPSIYTSLSPFSQPDNKTSSSSEMECDCPG